MITKAINSTVNIPEIKDLKAQFRPGGDILKLQLFKEITDAQIVNSIIQTAKYNNNISPIFSVISPFLQKKGILPHPDFTDSHKKFVGGLLLEIMEINGFKKKQLHGGSDAKQKKKDPHFSSGQIYYI